MSLPIPLNVDLSTARGNFRVTRDLSGLSFRSVIPGGYANCQIALDRPLDVDPADIAYYGTLTVSDGRHGGIVWQGRLEDPSRGVGSDGRIWDVAAVGPSAHTEDSTVPLIYVDTSMRRWQMPSGKSEPGVRLELTEESNGNPIWRIQIPEGTTIASPARFGVQHRALWDAGQSVARVRIGWDAAFTSSKWDIEIRTSEDAGSETVRDSASVSSSGGTLSWAMSSATSHNTVELVLERHTDTSTIGNNTTYAWAGTVFVRAQLKDAEGNDITSGYTSNAVLASEVVTDLLGRLLTQFDGATASVATTSTDIEQLAYPDGVTPREVLRDLTLFEPDYFWAAWEHTVNDLHRFEYKQWPTTVAYEATVADGYSSSGSSVELYDRVYVRWRDSAGRVRTTLRTQTVPELEAAGISRTASIDLGDEAASLDDATAGGLAAATAGDNFLAEHLTPPNAGQLTVARPIIDHDRGRLVQPWEITPGKLIRVRGIQPRVDNLNPGGRDGVTVFRVVGSTYDAGSATATLELDSQPLTVTHALAKLPHAQPSRERRR